MSSSWTEEKVFHDAMFEAMARHHCALHNMKASKMQNDPESEERYSEEAGLARRKFSILSRGLEEWRKTADPEYRTVRERCEALDSAK